MKKYLDAVNSSIGPPSVNLDSSESDGGDTTSSNNSGIIHNSSGRIWLESTVEKFNNGDLRVVLFPIGLFYQKLNRC